MLKKRLLIILTLAALVQPVLTNAAGGGVYGTLTTQYSKAVKEADNAIADYDDAAFFSAINSAQDAAYKLATLQRNAPQEAARNGINRAWKPTADQTIKDLISKKNVADSKTADSKDDKRNMDTKHTGATTGGSIRKEVVNELMRLLQQAQRLNDSIAPLQVDINALKNSLNAAAGKNPTEAEMAEARKLSAIESDVNDIINDAQDKLHNLNKTLELKKAKDDLTKRLQETDAAVVANNIATAEEKYKAAVKTYHRLQEIALKDLATAEKNGITEKYHDSISQALGELNTSIKKLKLAKARKAADLKDATSIASKLTAALTMNDSEKRKLTRITTKVKEFAPFVAILQAAKDPLADDAAKLLAEGNNAIKRLSTK